MKKLRRQLMLAIAFGLLLGITFINNGVELYPGCGFASLPATIDII